ncbi:MAG TPA: sigma-70 family RNA polymerase sigma factor [Gaiellaceae bacterium]|nr:sigma-70 family RNA polymerase sigma factor [Gaiellaceae bacterium]
MPGTARRGATRSRSDAELLTAARTDARPFRELYDRYAERVYGFQLRRCGDADAAHDLTAETFARAWESRETFRDEAGGSAGPWLFAIARHVLLASVRKGRLEREACVRLGVLERLELEPATAAPEERWLEGLDEALAELPDGQRRALVLRLAGECSYVELASALGTTPAAARVRVHRGLAALRARLVQPKETTP